MTMQEFIEQNRQLIDSVIHMACGSDFEIDDGERELWVENDWGLYCLAKDADVEGVYID